MITRLIKWLRAPRNGTQTAYRFFLRDWFVPDAEAAAAVMATARPSRALQPVIMEGPLAKRITVIAPHPDDEVIGPGGTLLRASDQGIKIDVIFLTEGSNDTQERKVRCAEAETVAAETGWEMHSLMLPLDETHISEQTVQAFVDALCECKPDVIFIPFLLDDNDDHRMASNLLLAASELNKSALANEVWAYQVYSPLPGNVLVPIGDRAEKKAELIRMYASQSVVRDWAHYALGLNAFNTRFTQRDCQDPYIEAFFVLPLDDYLDLCRLYERKRPN